MLLHPFLKALMFVSLTAGGTVTALTIDTPFSPIKHSISTPEKREVGSGLLFWDPTFTPPGSEGRDPAIVQHSKEMCSKAAHPLWWYELSGDIYCEFFEDGLCTEKLAIMEGSGMGDAGPPRGVLRSKNGRPADGYRCWTS